MFRHQASAKPGKASVEEEKTDRASKEIIPTVQPEKKVVETMVKKEDDAMIKDLLEKNLKWSQIIYEQNRKINNKLLWTAIGSWIKVFLILVPIILAAVFLAPMAQNLSKLYSEFLIGGTPSINSTNSLEQIMKLFPINSAQQEQLKAILK